MSDADDQPRCPECGEPIGITATYCVHCSTDLTEERAAADANEDGVWDQVQDSPETGGADGSAERTDGDDEAGVEPGPTATAAGTGELLAPDGLLDDTLTVLVGVVGGLVVGAVGTGVLVAATGSGTALLFGVAAWLGATAYLVRRRTVQAAVSRSGYAVAVVLLLVPLVVLSPVVEVEGGPGARLGGAFVLFLVVLVPAGVAAAIGWVAGRFVPEGAGGDVG